MRSIPVVTKNLLLINIVAFVASLVMGQINNAFGLHFFLSENFAIYQLFTYMFLHGGFTHILFNMFALWMFGCTIENVWGPKRFLVYYLVCGVGAGVMQELAQLAEFYVVCTQQIPGFALSDLLTVAENSQDAIRQWTTVGASGAVYGILLAFGMTFPEERLFIIPIPFPIKAKWFVLIYVAIELFSALGTRGDGVAHMAHLGGMLFGFLLIRHWTRHPNSYYYSGNGQRIFEQLRQGFERFKSTHKKDEPTHTTTRTTNSHESDWDYNARKNARQQEVDAILDKIRKSGYDSLSAEEKKRLFDNSNDL